jgi:hypothetical protein
MKQKKHIKKFAFRGRAIKQKGREVILSTIVPRHIAEYIFAEAELTNRTVSATVAELVKNRYSHLSR